MKKLTQFALILFTLLVFTTSINAIPIFDDSFNVTSPGDINHEYNTGRQTGTATPTPYVLWYDLSQYQPYVTNAGPNANQLIMPSDGSGWGNHSMFSPNANFTESGNFSVEVELYGFNDASWTSLNIFKDATLNNLWNDPGIGFMIYANSGTYNFYDGWHDNHPTGGFNFAELAYSSNPVLKVKYVVSQPSGFPPAGDAHIALFINGKAYPVCNSPNKYIHTANGGFTNNYLTIFSDAKMAINNLNVVPCSGKLSSSAWNNDADSGISATKTYTHAINLASTVATTTVNGVDFIGSGNALPQSGANWEYINISAGVGAYPVSAVGEAPNVTGTGAGLVTDCLIDTVGTSGGELTLTGLIPGKDYIIKLYGIGLNWGAASGRSNYFATSDGCVITILDQKEFGIDNGQIVSYQYTAPANGIFSITASPTDVSPGGVFCWYAFSNEEVPSSVWNGGAAGAWTNGANWIGGSVPQPGANVFFTNGANPSVSILNSSDIICGNITLGENETVSIANNEYTTNFVFDAGGASPLITLPFGSRLNFKPVAKGTSGYTTQGNPTNSTLNLGQKSTLISGQVNLHEINSVLINDSDVLQFADVSVAGPLVNLRKQAFNTKSLVIDKEGIVDAFQLTTGVAPQVIKADDGIVVQNGGMLSLGYDTINGVPVELVAPSVTIENYGKITVTCPNANKLSGSNITVKSTGQINFGDMNKGPGTYTINNPLTLSGNGQGQLIGALCTECNGLNLTNNSDITIIGDTQIGQWGVGGYMAMNKPVTGTGNLTLHCQAAHGTLHPKTFELNAVNTYNGNTMLRGFACSPTFEANVDDVFPNSELTLTILDHTPTLLYYDLNNFNQNITKLVVNAGTSSGGEDWVELRGNPGSKLAVSGNAEFNSGNFKIDGATLEIAGTLRVNGNAAISNINDIVLLPGAAIGGNGTIPSYTLREDNAVAPGNSVGTLNFDALNMEAGSSYDWEVGTNATGAIVADLVNVSIMFGLPTVVNSITVNVINTGVELTANMTNTLFQTPSSTSGKADKFVLTGPGTDSATIIENGTMLQITGLVPEPAVFGFIGLLGLIFFRQK